MSRALSLVGMFMPRVDFLVGPLRRPLSADVYKGAALFVLYTLALIAWFTTFQVLKNGALSGLSVLDDNKTNAAVATLAN